MQVEIQMFWQSQPLLLANVQDTFQQGDLYCVKLFDGAIQKFPLQHIYRIIEYPIPGMVAKR
ncbi:MAG: hypothetical protein WCT10_05215 [Patescibacteria group bacterium]